MNVKKVSYLFDKKQKIQFALLFVILFIGSIFEFVGVSMVIPVIDAMTNPEVLANNTVVRKIMTNLQVQSVHDFIPVILIGFIAVFVIKNIYLIIMTYIQYQILWSNHLKMEVRVMDILMHQPYSFHVKKNTAELQRTILNDIGNVFDTVENLFLLLAEIITSTMLIVLLLYKSPMITIFVILFLGVFMIAYFAVVKKRLYQYGKIGQEFGSESVKCINQAFGGIKEIKVYHSEGFFKNAYYLKRQRQISMMKRARFVQAVPKYFLEAIGILGVLIPVLIQVLNGTELSKLVSQLAVFAMAAFKLLPSINKMNAELAAITNNTASIDLVYSIVKETEQQISDADGKFSSAKEAQEIHFKDVSFAYENAEKNVLSRANLVIKPGESVAFIGPSGAGKTTTADLMLGILKPRDGVILYGQDSIYQLGEKWLDKIGYIPQVIYLSDDSIRNNIIFGRKYEGDDRIWKALESAQLADFIRNSPDGLDTIIGEAGVRLSGGQRQRIGIARALYNNPEILVLDEATSALDNETERAVMEAIDFFKGKKTLIVIAHRLSTIKNCDKVYEIKDGSITEVRNTV